MPKEKNRIEDEILENVSGGAAVTDPNQLKKEKEKQQSQKKKPQISATRRPRT